ncbi:hypothetical protein VP01_1877g8 [Puccinia sorghi]|uniref:Uncharacterized protein n=1 Tax=Puccinia sorghi TaxID=27349 RepID=A0A0L6VD34_9BASI|nr:hypothetical protein VP01_1877g8 [Puccinia sorghi]
MMMVNLSSEMFQQCFILMIPLKKLQSNQKTQFILPHLFRTSTQTDKSGLSIWIFVHLKYHDIQLKYVFLYLYTIANDEIWDILLLTTVSRKSTPTPSNSNKPCGVCQLPVNRRNEKNSASYVKQFLRVLGQMAQ